MLAVDDRFQATEGFLQVGNQPAVVVAEGGLGLGASNAVTDFVVFLPLLLLAFLHHGDGTLLGLPGIPGLADRAAHHHRDKGGNQYTVNPFQHQPASVSDKRSATIANSCASCRHGIALGALGAGRDWRKVKGWPQTAMEALLFVTFSIGSPVRHASIAPTEAGYVRSGHSTAVFLIFAINYSLLTINCL